MNNILKRNKSFDMKTTFLQLSYFALILTVLLGAFSKDANARRKPPKWVVERPVDPEYYIGIAVVSQNQADYMQTAKNNALADLISEISVNVSSSSILHQFEDNTGFKEEFESKVKTSIAEKIKDYELVGTWINKKEKKYWVYYRLNRNKYALSKRMELNKAKKLASTYYEEAKEAEKKNDIYNALVFYSKSIAELKDFLDQDLNVMTLEGRINLGTSIYNSIQDIMTKTKIIPEKEVYDLAKTELTERKFMFLAKYNGNPIAELPLYVDFSKGSGDINNKLKTNSEGVIKCMISAITSAQKLHELRAQIDLSDILNKENENYELNKMFFNPATLANGKTILKLERTKAYFEFSENIFGEASKRKILANQMKKELSDNFFSFTIDKTEADVIVKVESRATKGAVKEGKNYKVFLVYVDCFFTITDMVTGNEIFNEALYEVRGMKPISYDYALREGYDSLIEEIHSQIIPKLNKLSF
ncbi:MAG: LPP20 family lipoprotein [Marinifilaceae bacterium]|jgi:hypothetical protein|nr:LPP20 family lipoprotein [Marinifilaceae bacterium]